MRPFDYFAPPTLEEAISALGSSARPLAGGTDLLTLMKEDLHAPERLIAVRRLLPSGIASTAEGTVIGAATPLSEIADHAHLATHYAALTEAARSAASPQLRNMATLGGNLVQRPRCWYFRNRHVQCWLKGGDTCFAREGENRQHALFGGGSCVAVHPSDLAPALLACDALLTVAGALGQRSVTMDELYALPDEKRRAETTLGENDLIVALRLPAPQPGTRSLYLKAMDRAQFAFALVGVAAVARLTPDGRRFERLRLVLSGVAPIPWRSQAAECMLTAETMSDRLFAQAADAALAGAVALAHNGWKIPLLKALIVQALNTLAAPPASPSLISDTSAPK